MKIQSNIAWVFYFADKMPSFDPSKVGKWMYFFADRAFVESVCKAAIESGVVLECKHSNKADGVACFYLHDDDMEGHRHVIQFFMDNGLISKTKAGKLYNISFKRNSQTLSGQYGSNYSSDIKLQQFVDLYTGEFMV